MNQKYRIVTLAVVAVAAALIGMPAAGAARVRTPQLHLVVRSAGPYKTVVPSWFVPPVNPLVSGPLDYMTRSLVSPQTPKWSHVEVQSGNGFNFNNTLGPDASMWFAMAPFGGAPTGLLADKRGTISFYPVTTNNAAVTWTAPGQGGDMWFHDAGNGAIGHLLFPSGAVTEYSLPLPPSSFLFAMSAGPDGNIWSDCGQGNYVCQVIASGSNLGQVNMVNLPAGQNSIYLASGHDGNVWFTTGSSSQLGFIDPSTYAVTMVNGPAVNTPSGIATDNKRVYFSTSHFGASGSNPGTNAICQVAYANIGAGFVCFAVPARLTGINSNNIGGLAVGASGLVYFPNMGHVGEYIAAHHTFKDLGQAPMSPLLNSNASAIGRDGNFYTFSGQSPSEIYVRNL